MGKISLLSLGCPKNLVDSEKLLKRLAENGVSYVDNPKEADILMINTCGFIDDAKKESVSEILGLVQEKAEGNKKLVVFGCLAKRYGEELKKEIPEIDMICGVGEEDKIIEYCLSNTSSSVNTQGRKRISETAYAYLKIAEGCNRGCSYCVIPDIRGKFSSRKPVDILRDAEELIGEGRREIIVVAQDITSYGSDLGGQDLPKLLHEICSLSGDFWVRLLYLYPTSITDDLIAVVRDEEKICKYLDIPLQHTEKNILRLMRRAGGREYYEELIAKIREQIPDVALRSTLITGFPQESDEDFNNMLDFVKRIKFDRLGVFTYSREKGSAAYALKGHLPVNIRKKRMSLIMAAQSKVSFEINRRLVGKTFRALIDDIDKDICTARIYSQAPEIDGVTFLKGVGLQRHEFCNVRISKAFDYDLQGEVLP